MPGLKSGCGDRATGSMTSPLAASLQARLTHEQQVWLHHSELLWRQAHEIGRLHPEHDPTDLYTPCAASS
jgi:predicted PhzF superfamily epimerase YddE/YHI9